MSDDKDDMFDNNNNNNTENDNIYRLDNFVDIFSVKLQLLPLKIMIYIVFLIM
jgi:hypothetical protein